MSGIIAVKCGTTRAYSTTDQGAIDQVTILEVSPNFITMIKESEKDGYKALQLASIPVKEKHISAAQKKIYANLGIEPQRVVKEMRFEGDKDGKNFSLGEALNVGIFKNIPKVDVVSNSKGKGFAGCVKRHNFSMQRATHGNSLSHRAPGSIGQCQFPGRVNPGKKMAGRMGHTRVTIKNLKVHSIDEANNLIMLVGSIPGAKGSVVFIKSKEITGRK